MRPRATRVLRDVCVFRVSCVCVCARAVVHLRVCRCCSGSSSALERRAGSGLSVVAEARRATATTATPAMALHASKQLALAELGLLALGQQSRSRYASECSKEEEEERRATSQKERSRPYNTIHRADASVLLYTVVGSEVAARERTRSGVPRIAAATFRRFQAKIERLTRNRCENVECGKKPPPTYTAARSHTSYISLCPS